MLDDVQMKVVGIREGEKLHEIMITKDDSRRTYEYENHYIIYPDFDWWSFDRYFTEGGELIRSGFEYDSGTNEQWLSVEELRNEMHKLDIYEYKK